MKTNNTLTAENNWGGRMHEVRYLHDRCMNHGCNDETEPGSSYCSWQCLSEYTKLPFCSYCETNKARPGNDYCSLECEWDWYGFEMLREEFLTTPKMEELEHTQNEFELKGDAHGRMNPNITTYRRCGRQFSKPSSLRQPNQKKHTLRARRSHCPRQNDTLRDHRSGMQDKLDSWYDNEHSLMEEQKRDEDEKRQWRNEEAAREAEEREEGGASVEEEEAALKALIEKYTDKNYDEDEDSTAAVDGMMMDELEAETRARNWSLYRSWTMETSTDHHQAEAA